MPGLERLARRSAEAKRLLGEARQLQQLAITALRGKDPASAVELLDQRAKLLREEIEAIEQLAAKEGDASGELGKVRKDLEGQLREAATQAMLETKLHLLGLEELVPGALWRGPHDQIQRAIAEVRSSGGVGSLDPHTQRWRLALDGGEVEIQAVGSAHERSAGDRRRPGQASAREAPRASEAPATGAPGSREVERNPNPGPAEAERDGRSGISSNAPRGRDLPEFPIARSSINDEVSEGASYFAVSFSVTVDSRVIELGNGKVQLARGRPTDLPDLTLHADYRRNHQDYALHIYDDITLGPAGSVPTGKGERTPLTGFALKKFIARYKARFGHEPEGFFGTLIESNRLNFQREYVTLLLDGVSEPRARIEAIHKISFGRHRADLGYTELEVELSNWSTVDLGGKLGTRRVPSSIEITARRR
jgi:hypothetical protein